MTDFWCACSQTRCAARGEYCTTNEQCCSTQEGVECMTLNGIGQCLSDRDRAVVFESPCESTDDCADGYCCVVPAGYRRSRVRRCKPKRADDARCPDEAMEEYQNYLRFGKGKRRTEYASYKRHGYYWVMTCAHTLWRNSCCVIV